MPGDEHADSADGGPADLSLSYREPDAHIALVGLAPVYVHGLQMGLNGAGMKCSVLRAVGELPPLLAEHGLVVVVLPPELGPVLSGLRLEEDARLEAVHVLAESSVQAYAQALRDGATGAFPITAELDDVVWAVRCAAEGTTALPVEIARGLGRTRSGQVPVLEPHERNYLRVLANGATVAGLARQSGYSEREMYRLLSGVYARLGAHNRTEALLLAERWGFLDEEQK